MSRPGKDSVKMKWWIMVCSRSREGIAANEYVTLSTRYAHTHAHTDTQTPTHTPKHHSYILGMCVCVCERERERESKDRMSVVWEEISEMNVTENFENV